jgi:hypothetical protein
VNATGSTGGIPFIFTIPGIAYGITAAGASSLWGSGGVAVLFEGGANVTGSAASGYGAGGSAAGSYIGTAAAGGAGTQGIVIITEYV